MTVLHDSEPMLTLASALERACRLASVLEGILKDQASRNEEVGLAEYAPWVMAAELLCVLDEGRASMLLLKPGMDGGMRHLPAKQA